MAPVPPHDSDEDHDGRWNSDDERDYQDQQSRPPSPMAHYPGAQNPLIRFLSHIPDWSVLDKVALDNALSGLPVPISGPVPAGLSVQEAIKEGLVPALDPKEASGIITGSEQILRQYAQKASLTAKDILALIQDVLHNPDFNADDVDTDMLKRFADSIDSGDLEIINMHKDGDGPQKLELFKRPAEKVLRELMSDIRLSGCQHFGFKEYLDPHGNRLFAGHANGSVTFQIAQTRVGQGKVPVSLVIYIDATYIKRGIPILTYDIVRCQYARTMSYTIYTYDIVRCTSTISYVKTDVRCRMHHNYISIYDIVRCIHDVVY